MATYSVWQAAAIGGSPLSLKPGTSITVNREADGVLVPLKADRLGAGSKSNPFTVGSDGIARFYAAAGRYRVIATLSGFDPIEWKDVALGTAAETDFDSLSGDVIVNGQPTGIRLLFDDATAAADPGTGEWRANHATFASITALYIDNAQQDGDSITAWLDALDDGGTAAHRCVLRYENVDDPQQWAEFNVTGSVTDSTGFRTLTVTPRAQAGWRFTAGDVTAATFDRTGIQGNDGADGTDPGILLTFDADTADSNQGSGKVWLDNATLTSATVLYISKTNRAGSDIAAKLARLDDSTNPAPKAEGILTRPSDGAQLTFAMGAVTDATGYVKIAISGVAGASSFTANDVLSFQAERVGDAGGGLANLVDDTTPQLGGMLDVNGQAVGDGTLELLTFTETASAVNQVNVANAATGNAPIISAAGDNTNIDLSIVGKGTGRVSIDGNRPMGQGKHTISIPATAMRPRTANGCAPLAVVSLANNHDFPHLAFDASTGEFATFIIPMPKGWNEGTISFRPRWSHPSTTTNFGVLFGIRARAISDGEAMNFTAISTGANSVDTGGTTDYMYTGPESSAYTIEGSPAEGDLVLFEVYRAPTDGSDTLAVDARLHAIEIFYTTNAATDA